MKPKWRYVRDGLGHPPGCGCKTSGHHTWAELDKKGLWCNCDRCITERHANEDRAVAESYEKTKKHD